MATRRNRRRKTTSQLRDDIRAQLDALRQTKPDTDPDRDRRAGKDEARPLTLREEYREALKEFNTYSNNNETIEALHARERLDRADRNRLRWWRRS